MSKNLPQISEWKRVFVDTSFIIDSVSTLKEDLPKFKAVNRTQKLLEHLKLSASKKEQKITWITSSIVLSELTKFENKDAVEELQKIFDSSDLEIINFTRKEARILIDDLEKFIEPKHVSVYLKELKKTLAENNIFNPKNMISNDALIIACAKSKRCDVVLTSDKNSFLKIAQQVDLPILNSEDIPFNSMGYIEYEKAIFTDYD